MALPTYKLIYFNGRGRAELIRYIFAQSSVKYEDKRVTWDEWQELKPNTPYGSLPVLEEDGKQLADSGVIARYLSELYCLAGKNKIENAEIASLASFVDDFMTQFMKYKFEKDEARKAEAKKDLEENQIPRYFSVLDKTAANNVSIPGWIYGRSVTYVDLKIHIMMSLLTEASFPVREILYKYPALDRLKSAVALLPNISMWLERRPKTEF